MILNYILGALTFLAAILYVVTTRLQADREAAEDARKQRIIDEFNRAL